MATLILSAAGAHIGASVGGAVLGVSSAVIGRAIGATVGRLIDQRIVGTGSRAVETGKVQTFRLAGAGEGDPIERVWARMRVPGQVIWATNFRETTSTTVSGGGGGKGVGRTQSTPRTVTTEYRYSVSLALALCEGRALRVDRVWANGQEIALSSLNLRFHSGAPDQMPDPKIEAVEGAGNAPAYRGLAYVVIEDLDLAPFGNRVPQFAFEVVRPAEPQGLPAHPRDRIRGVALIPGTGEYALATTPVHYALGPARNEPANVSSARNLPDIVAALDALDEEMPAVSTVSLVVSWFGDNLKCGEARIEPRVEQTGVDSPAMPWVVSGLARAQARTVSQIDGRPVYGGTPADASVIEAIVELKARGKAVTFYPFILMDIQAGNGLGDPWTGAADQPVMPWRGRITQSVAAGRTGSPDGTAAADAEVAAFFGTAQVSDFDISSGAVVYSGPAEWSFRRFILHYAHLAKLAGGVARFLIGSEMVGLTRIRGANGFPAVAQLKALAADVKAVLGAGVQVSYAADWSEYFGYHPQDGSGDVYFHLDPLWADDNVDFIGIDNYMPLSDWRDGTDHADAGHPAIYDQAYLQANIEGGEGFDWFYASAADRAAQRRTPITDGAHGEDWVFRYKDLRAWWVNQHHERIGGVRMSAPTAWVPESKPIVFTEYGCPAVDKGTNQPNVFHDPKSSESALPYFSTGDRDDLIQLAYLEAFTGYWDDPAHNPVSTQYGGPMIDLGASCVWAWDARPYPQFPADTERWSDGPNYRLGHWISGRMGAETLARVVAEICERNGLDDYDVSQLFGVVRGYHLDRTGTARSALQPLMMAYGFDAADRLGKVAFLPRHAVPALRIDDAALAETADAQAPVQAVRGSEADVPSRVRALFHEADGNYEVRVAEAADGSGRADDVDETELPLVLTQADAATAVSRWLAEAAAARDGVRASLGPAARGLGAGDVVEIAAGGKSGRFRIDRVESGEGVVIEGVRVDPAAYARREGAELAPPPVPFRAPVPVTALFMDLPMITGEERPGAPHVAIAADPWPGTVAIYSSADGQAYTLNTLIEAGLPLGVTETALAAATPGRWDRSEGVTASFAGGEPLSASAEAVLNGANLAAIGSGSGGDWELFQYQTAELIGPGRYRLSGLLRGQAGSDAEMPASWPAGSLIVLLPRLPDQIALAAAARRLERHYRIGEARVPSDHASYTEQAHAFEGRNLRPLSVVHLRQRQAGSGDHRFDWIRRGRLDADSWEGTDIPLGEEFEVYSVRILAGGAVVREASVTVPEFAYTAAQRAADGVAGAYQIEVAQLSGVFGAGPYVRLNVDG